MALLIVLLLSSAAGAKLNRVWLLPGGDAAIDLPLLDGEPYRFCALTFDDGPDAKYTGQVMGILDSHGIRATFFLVGTRIADYPLTTEALANSSHELGNHSQDHPDMSRLGEGSQRRQLAGVCEQLAMLGVSTRWFRPPYGAYNQATIRLAREQGMATVNWTVDPRDWSQPGVDTIISRVLKHTTPGAVILLHSTNAQTVAALPEIIAELRTRGYSFVTMSEWRALMTGETAPPAVELRDVFPGIGGGLAAPLGKLLAPTDEPSALEPQHEPVPRHSDVPRIIEKLEGRTPAGRAHLVWSAIQDKARGELAAPAGARAVPLAATTPESANALLPEPDEQLAVYTNFGDCDGLCRVFIDGGSERLQLVGGGTEHVVEVLLQPTAQESAVPQQPVEIEDVPVTPAASLPMLPEGEELVIPPDTVEQLAPLDITPLAEPAEAPGAPAVEGDVPLPVEDTAPPVAPVELDPLPFRIIDLVDMENAATLWQPPANIDGASLTGWQPPLSEPGPRAEPRYYFLAMTGNLEEYTWVELGAYVRLAKLSGMVLPTERYYGAPPVAAPYPWTYANLAYLDRGAWVDLTVEDVADVMELIKRGKENVFVIVRPSNLHFFIAAHLWAEMNTNMRDFVLFRQMTGGMEYAPATGLSDWTLPDGVELARFTDGSRVTLVLYSQSYKAQRLQVPASASHMSHAFIDAGGYLKLVPLANGEVTVDRSPAILYYEYAAP